MDRGKYVVLFLAALVAGCAASGKVIIEQYKDVTPTRFEGAVAVVLEERENAKVSDDGKGVVEEGYMRIKLLDRKAMDCSEGAPNCRIERMFPMPSEEGYELEMFESKTIAPDGQVFEVEKDDMRDVMSTDWAVPDADRRFLVYNAKGASPGAIIEERWRFRVDKISSLGGMTFQQRDPVLEVSYTLDTPADYKYKWKTYKIDIQPTEKKVGNRIIRTWTARDVPPLIQETYSVPPDDLRAKLYIVNQEVYSYDDISDFTTIKTWEDVGKWWLRILKDQQKVTPEVKAVADEINQAGGTDTEKLKRLWEWMNKNIRYVARSADKYDRGHRPLAAHVVCTKKYGDCKAVANFISVVGRQMGLKADPIIIGTRPSLGRLQAVELDLPGPFYFNHSIARVEADGKVYWMDANHRQIALGVTPARDQGVHVVVANPDKPFLDFIPFQPPEVNQWNTKAVYIPTGDGGMNFNLESSATGIFAEKFRRRSYDYTPGKFQTWIEWYMAESYPQIAEVKQSYTGKEDNNAPFDMKISGKIPRAFQSAGKGISFEVKMAFWSGADAWRLLKRRSTMDLGHTSQRVERIEVKIPEGMEPVGLPKNIMLDDEFMKVERLSQIENDRVVTRLFTSLKMVQIPPEKYAEARKTALKVFDACSFVLLFEPAEKKKVSRRDSQ
jgi:hypothetical protein